MTKLQLYSAVFLLNLWNFAPVFALEPTKIDPEPTCDNADGVNTYDIFRKGKEIGSHRVCFANVGDEFHVVAETKMKVKVLFVTVYKYLYVSKEVYRNGDLKSISAYVDDNGKEWSTIAERQGDGYYVETDEGNNTITTDFFTTNHWNMNVVNYSTLYNTLTGELNEVNIEPYSPDSGDTVTPEGLRYEQSQVYNVRGELDINTIYGVDGNWLGMYFNHKDDSLIEFRCVDCRNTPSSIPEKITS